MGLGLLSIYLNLKWKQNDFLKHILIIYEMVKCKLPGDMVTQTVRAQRAHFFLEHRRPILTQEKPWNELFVSTHIHTKAHSNSLTHTHTPCTCTHIYFLFF